MKAENEKRGPRWGLLLLALALVLVTLLCGAGLLFLTLRAEPGDWGRAPEPGIALVAVSFPRLSSETREALRDCISDFAEDYFGKHPQSGVRGVRSMASFTGMFGSGSYRIEFYPRAGLTVEELDRDLRKEVDRFCRDEGIDKTIKSKALITPKIPVGGR